MVESDNLSRVFNGLQRAYSHSKRPGKWSTVSEVDSWTQSGKNVGESLEVLVKKGQAIKKNPLLYRLKDGMAGPMGSRGGRGKPDTRGDRPDTRPDDRGDRDGRRSERKTDDRKPDDRGKTPEDRRREAERKAARDRQNAAMMSIMLDGSAPISSSTANIPRTVR